MSTNLLELTVSLLLVAETPLSVGAGGSAGTFADKTIVRDGFGRHILPGSQIKGKLRHTTEAMARTLGFRNLPKSFTDSGIDKDGKPDNVITRLFGSDRVCSPLVFNDLVGVVGELPEDLDDLRNQTEQRREQIRPSVALNRNRRVAEDARLLFQETSLPEMRFFAQQAIVGRLPDRSYAGLLWAALLLTPRWGSAKTRGLGWMRIEQMVFTFDKNTDERLVFSVQGAENTPSQLPPYPFGVELHALAEREQPSWNDSGDWQGGGDRQDGGVHG